MKNFLKLSVVAIGLMFASCSSDDDVSRSPKIKISVVGGDPLSIYYAKPINNATVLVFDSKDFEKNPIAKGVTNEAGIIEFTKDIVFDKEYYIDVNKDCINNYNSLIYGIEEVTIVAKDFDDIELSTLDVRVKETGTVILTNNSANGYLIKLLDKAVGTITIGETMTFDYFPVNSSYYKIINLDTNEELKLEKLAICGDTKEYVLK
ncbi:hypothetical protein G1K75_09460 [Tenacibaculum finnmarkense]|uniref:hypothetical protein n=1 Tax=Tenacibaculum finnmarkense TaxID=2781243 RepID=UPI001EFBB006|nr:hypothetical protein [Tenacibaculum finnmarkense]MCG8805883.1 hypothetical protein [Tenacibaculum finnmarkense]